MSDLVIRPCTISDLENAENFPDLIEEYAKESAIHGLPHPNAKMSLYKQIETAGAIYPFAAYLRGALIGFATVLMSIIPHYGIGIAVTESLYVAEEHRKTGAGIKLINTAKGCAKHHGSPGILICAPTGGVLAELLAKSKWTET